MLKLLFFYKEKEQKKPANASTVGFQSGVLSCKGVLNHFCTMDMIRLQDIIPIMRSGEKLSIGFIKWDEKRNSGGEKVEVIERVAFCGREITDSNEPAARVSKIGKATHSRNPLHGIHFTANLQLPGKLHPMKLHMRLIYMFNGKRVYW